MPEYVQLFRGPCGAERPLDAPPPLDISLGAGAGCVRATGRYSCYTSRSSSTATRSAGCGVFTSTRSMCSAQRDGRAVAWIATGFAD
ncbi:hypothetical protein CesoFtcFv8_009264 [Champsocephalus esox]|uniref:Uncharacterized protein n=2 Tax=Champsocephalus TaxID=52236 RepID=A0AAN8DZ36_CHAGU|nr:hypothetical protein CesoFtcFv8_009264 [Champsocephalus esox]KAK5926938.1 hypothetical protein CgunFtcFv8_022471 [Champsocephalus gunnari]